MKSWKKFFLAGVLATGIAVSGLNGVAAAQTLNCGGASLDIDAPCEMTRRESSSKSDSVKGQKLTLDSVLFSTPFNKKGSSVLAVGFNLVVTGSAANKISMADYFNDAEFMNDIKNTLQSSLTEAGIKADELSFHDDNFNGLPGKRAQTEVQGDGAKVNIDMLAILKDNAIWVVCVVAPDQEASQNIVNTIR